MTQSASTKPYSDQGEGWTVWDGLTVPSLNGRDSRKGLIWFTHETEQEALARGETEIFYWPWFGEDRLPCVRAYRITVSEIEA